MSDRATTDHAPAEDPTDPAATVDTVDTVDTSSTTTSTDADGQSEADSDTESTAGPRPRTSTAPWITAGVAGVVLAALLLVYFVVLVPDKNDSTGSTGDAAGNLTTSEKQAVVAAGTSAANLLTFRRAHFDADYTRALDGTTGTLRSDVASKKALTLKTMTQGKFDLGADVTHQALEGPTTGKQKGYLVLVTVNGYRSTTKNQPVQQNLELTMVEVKGKWLASDVSNIGAM